MATGTIFNLQQFSTEDGPGIRTTVFLKGCPLRCAWCHNPEGLERHPELVWHDTRCMGSRDCLRACPEDALALAADGMHVDRGRCTVCGACVEACPAGAFERIGRECSAIGLVAELRKDQTFYETSGGGVTFSGGEPLAQVEFLCEVLPLCKAAGLHVAIDTCGAVATERYARVRPWLDLVLYDLKIADAARHAASTGVSNELVLRNVRWLADSGVPLWIRTPVVPGHTAETANIRAIGEFIRDRLPTVARWDLLAYTNLGRPKYHRLDRPYALEGAALPARDEMEALWRTAVALVPAATWSGAAQ